MDSQFNLISYKEDYRIGPRDLKNNPFFDIFLLYKVDIYYSSNMIYLPLNERYNIYHYFLPLLGTPLILSSTINLLKETTFQRISL